MAVYTKLAEHDVKTLLSHYQIGVLDQFEEISAGIENTNYFVDTQCSVSGQVRRWVLTIFENVSAQELPYFSDLTNYLAREGFKVPAPLKTKKGEYNFSFQNKTGLIVPRLKGRSLTQPDQHACAEVGRYLADMHLSLRDFTQNRRLVRDINWMQTQTSLLEGQMGEAEFSTLSFYLARYLDYSSDLQKCPQGTVHGDLFRDNVLFEKGKISGVFDFYHACNATLLFDLAVIANDWTVEEGVHDSDKLFSLVSAYQSQRPWTEMEHLMWPKCLELAALRFWLSRLLSLHLPSYQQESLRGETLKNPDEMKAILVGLSHLSA